MVNVKEYDLKLRSNVMHYGWGWRFIFYFNIYDLVLGTRLEVKDLYYVLILRFVFTF